MVNAQNISSIKVGIDSTAAKSGAAEVGAALKSIENSLKSLQKIMKDTAKAAGATGGGAGAGGTGKVGGAADPAAAKNIKETNTGLQMFMGLLNKVRNTLFVLYLVREAFDGITDALNGVILTGLEFNKIMEDAVIGTGGLIAQIATLSRNGVELKGVDEIRAGMELAKKEVLALQIAGLQTAATSEALVNAFQQAVGPGLAAGLALKQVRDLTVDIVQVATSIGLPMHQIAQEVRAILEGSIDPNARVAKILQIDNATIKRMKEAGTLADYLFKKLDTFREIGPIIEQSFSGAISNIEELGQVLSGIATQPLFDALKKSIVDINNSLRAGGAGKDAKSLFDVFSPDIQKDMLAFQRVFAELGDTSDRVLDTLIDRLRDLAIEFSNNPKFIDDMTRAIANLGDAIIKFINAMDTESTIKGTIDSVNFLVTVMTAVYNVAHQVARAFRMWDAIMNLILKPIGTLINILIALNAAIWGFKKPGQAMQDLQQRMAKSSEESAQAWRDLKKEWADIDASKVESDLDRILQSMTGMQIVAKGLKEDLAGVNWQFGLWDSFDKAQRSRAGEKGVYGGFGAVLEDAKKPMTREEAIKLLGGGGNAFQIGRVMRGENPANVIGEVAVQGPPKPAHVTTESEINKAKRAAEKAEAEARAFQLAKLQRAEQVARDEAELQDKYNKIFLQQNQEKFDRGLISEYDYEQKKKAIQVEGAEVEKGLALQRAQDTLIIAKKTLDKLVPGDLASKLSEGDQALDDLLKRLKAAVPSTQAETEALRELEQAVIKLKDANLELKKARGGFDVDKLPFFKPEPTRELAVPIKSEQIAQSASLVEKHKELIKLRRTELDIEKAEMLGSITHAEAIERQADAAEARTLFEIQQLESDKKALDIATQSEQIHQKDLEIMEKMSQVFRLSNAQSFFKGLNQELETLSQKFERLGEDLRGVFRDAFSELGKTGVKGFADSFLNGIADMLRTRAADSLSTVAAKLFTDIFRKAEGQTQSVFDSFFEKILGIFGRKATGTFSIGGIFEKIFGKLLDPLGRRGGTTAPIPGSPNIGLPPNPKDVVLQLPEERMEISLTGIHTDTTSILREVMDAAASLREMKACCAEHNSLLQQQMQASKGPGLLGQLLGSAVGALAGGLTGAYFPSGTLGGVKVLDDKGVVPGGGGFDGNFFPSPGLASYGSPTNALTPNITNNITIQTPNPAAFNAPQTQAQIGSLMFNSLQKSQTLVGSINNPTTPK